MKKISKTPLTITLGSALATGLISASAQATPNTELDANPFKIDELSTGYMQTVKAEKDSSNASKMKDGACGEGKCGSAMMKGAEEKTAEGNCAGNKPMPKDSKGKKGMEGKCGEGKCGSSM